MPATLLTLAGRRELLAELRLLEEYDSRRRRLSDDYGCGQRAAEISRRRRELGRDAEAEITPLELELAYARIGRRRIRAAVRAWGLYGTKASRYTLDAWRAIERRHGRVA